MVRLVAGVDSSTQSCKVVIRDADTGALVRTGRAPHPAGTEVDPEAWWVALQLACAEAGGLDDVVAISVAAQQHGMVVLDDEGRVIRPALLWNDTRSAGAVSDLVAELGADTFAGRTGSLPVASFTIAKLRWLRDAEPEAAARVAAVALPHDWLSWRLRGYGPGSDSPLGAVLEELTTDRSDASGTGYWGPDGYDRELFVQALGRDAILPRVLSPGEAAGHMPSGTLVGAGMGDNAAAALGLDARPGDAVVSIGTSGTVFAVSPSPTADPSGTIAGFADATGEFLPLVCTLNAARVLDSIAALLGVDLDALGHLALEADPGASGVVLVPYFEGERTPNLPDATATFAGLSLGNTTRPNIARASIEGMLCGLAAGLDALRGEGLAPERLLLIGGAAQNEAVGVVASHVFDLPITVPATSEYVADGAARQASWALTGVRPEWPVKAKTTMDAAHVPEIMRAYSSAAAAAAAAAAVEPPTAAG